MASDLPPQFVATFIVLAICGISICAFLTWKHHQKKKTPLVCPLHHDCSIVTESAWSHLFYFRNETLGLFYYVSMLVGITGTLFFSVPGPRFLMLLPYITGFGVLFSAFLVGVQIFKIKDYCFYCLISALVTILLFLNSLALTF
ncbi:hypothetical protein HZB03_00770 [Candidatus Woesearchaeota archaeon]|nr:hypothetical protein [Candidatus Woesearchaeota archaeon]